MANNRRLPSGSATADWASTSYWTLGAAPVDTDSVYLEIGGDTITLNLSQPGIDLNLLHFGIESRYNVGAEGTPLIIDVNNGGAGKVEIFSIGDYIYLQAGTGGTFPLFINNPGNPAHRTVLTTSVITTLHQFAGVLVLRGTVTGTTLNVHGGSVQIDYTGSNGWANINVYAGSVNLQRDFSGTLTIYGGVVTLDDANNGVTFGAVVVNGGVLRHVNGNAGDITVNGGAWDKSRLAKSGLTVGNVVVKARSKIINNAKGIDVTASSTTYTGGSPDISTGGGQSVI